MLNSRISAATSATSTAVAARGGKDPASDFRAAFANAVNAQEAVPAGAGGASGQHAVKAGETLYGIARARLAAAGQAATPGAAMRHALDIAKANDIRNPDRIRTGQQLVLAPLADRLTPPIDSTAASSRVIAPTDNASAVATPSGASNLMTRSPSPLAPLSEGSGEFSIDDRGPHAIDELDVQLDTTEVDAPDRSEIVRDTAALPHAVADVYTPAQISTQLASSSQADALLAPRADLSLYTRAAPEAPKPSGEVPDIVYKGVIGKALDLLPLDPSTRTSLQQANAVVSSSIAARTLAAATGIGGPILTIAGLVWGLFAASKIGAQQSSEPKQIAQNDVTARVTE